MTNDNSDLAVNEFLREENPELLDGGEQEQIYKAAVEILKKLRENKRISARKLTSQIEGIIKPPPKSYVIYRNILAASKERFSPVQSSGRGKGGGYYYDENLVWQTITAEYPGGEKEAEQEKDEKQTQERHVWPLVEDWMRTNKKYAQVSSDVANRKSGGKWGNPDVVALTPFAKIGFFDVEIATAEVKTALANWRQFFFEAASHKRFSEKSYFVFRVAEDEKYEDEELISYGEKFGVGIVEIRLSNDQYDSLVGWNELSDGDKIELMECFVERFPAPFSPVSLKVKCEYLERLGIRHKDQLYSFGREDG